MSSTLADLRRRWDRARMVLGAPRIAIDLYGDEQAEAAYRAFTARHPRFKVTSAKRWGAALLRLPESLDAYLAASSLPRRKRRQALKAGFRHEVVHPLAHLDDILAVNRSAPTRQGRAMSAGYVDPDAVARSFARDQPIDAILDAEGRLRAYAVVPDLGDAFVFSQILGHADDLEHGIMYLLVSEAIGRCIDRQRPDGSPHWLFYDTFWGASDGLVFFKQRLGFTPYTVDWRWRDAAEGRP